MANWGERKNFGNSFAEIQQKWGERKRKRGREKAEEFRQHCYRNSSAQNASGQLKKSNCGNVIAEKGKKKKICFGNCGNAIADNVKKKKKKFILTIVAIPLLKMEKKKLWNLWMSKKKSCHVHNIFTIFSQ